MDHTETAISFDTSDRLIIWTYTYPQKGFVLLFR